MESELSSVGIDIQNEEWGDINLSLDTNQTNKAIQQIADKLTNENHFLTITGDNTEQRDIIYLYEGGIYIPKGREFIRNILQRELSFRAKSHLIKEVIFKIGSMTSNDRDIFEQTPKNLLCFNNGVYDLNEKKFVSHHHSIKFISKIKANYNPEATCPKILDFFKWAIDEEDLNCFQEWIGFCLLPEYKYKKALIIEGVPNTGKTTALNVINAFIGESNISNVSLQHLALDRFASANLRGKYLNVVDDLSFTDVKSTGMFKMVTGRSLIEGQKKFMDSFSFYNYAKLLYACNKIPPVKDIDDVAYFGRWIPLTFENVIGKEKQNNNLIKELTTEQELSGLLNWALEGLERLESKGDFSFKKTPEEVKKLMCSSGNPLYTFTQDCCQIVQAKDIWISKRKAYDLYVKYCNENNTSFMSIERFARNFPKFCPVFEGNRKVELSGKQYKVYLNLTINGESGISKDNEKEEGQERLELL